MRAGLRVGGIEVELRIPRGPLEALVADRYSPFLGAVERPACRVALEPTGETAGAPNSPLAVLTGGAGAEVRIEHRDFAAELDLAGAGSAHVAANAFTVDHFFRMLFSLLAPRHDALLLHACGVITRGHAEVFAGESGAGKSTLARLAGTRPLLSDEHVLVRRSDGAWFAASTPFWGGAAPPGPAREAPLGSLWRLRQWPTIEVRGLGATEALHLALGNAVLPGPDPALKRLVFAVAVEVARDVPAAELCFTPSERVWEKIDDRVVA